MKLNEEKVESSLDFYERRREELERDYREHRIDNYEYWRRKELLHIEAKDMFRKNIMEAFSSGKDLERMSMIPFPYSCSRTYFDLTFKSEHTK